MTKLPPENQPTLHKTMVEEAAESSSSSTTTPLHEAINLISSLISLSHSIKVFSAKWQSIRFKFEELLSNLAAIDKLESAHNPSLSAVLRSIRATLVKCDALAKQCARLSYSGKLLMQSDLDIISGEIDAHVRRIFDVYAVELLARNDAVVVAKPRAAASADDVRFYAVDLLSRFRIGSSEMKKQALVAFNEVIREDERYVDLSLQLDNLVGFLVNFLDSDDCEIQSEAAKAVWLLTKQNPSHKTAFIGAGVISRLIRVLESENETSKDFAIKSLLEITENSDNSWSVSAHGGVTVLLKICAAASAAELVALACLVLKNLVGVEEIKRFVVEEGGIIEFIRLTKSKNELININSIDLLQTIGNGEESIKEIIIEEGGIRALTKIFSPKSTFKPKTREMALRGIMNICCSSQKSSNLLINHGFMDHILYFLKHGDVFLQELSIKASFWLCGTSDEGKKLMGEAGFIPVLVKFLDSKSNETREMAAETISSMITVPKNRKKFLQNDQNLGLLLRMLDPEEVNSGNKKLLLSILASLARSSVARKKIVSSGYLKNIEKLAENHVSDAKKIVRKVSSTRLGSMWNGIWHS